MYGVPKASNCYDSIGKQLVYDGGGLLYSNCGLLRWNKFGSAGAEPTYEVLGTGQELCLQLSSGSVEEKDIRFNLAL